MLQVAVGAEVVVGPVGEPRQAFGVAFGAQFKAAPDVMEGGGALFISTMQIALATGSLLGGVVVDHFGLGFDMAGAGIAALAAAVVVWRFGHDRLGSLQARREADALQ